MIARDIAVEAETQSPKVEEKFIESVTVSPVSDFETKEQVFDLVDTVLDKSTGSVIYLPVDKLPIAFLKDIKVAKDSVKFLHPEDGWIHLNKKNKLFSKFEFRVLSEAEYVIHPE